MAYTKTKTAAMRMWWSGVFHLSLPALGESRLLGSLSLTLDFTSGEIYLLALQGRMKGHSRRKTGYLPNSSDCSMQSESKGEAHIPWHEEDPVLDG